MNSKKINASFLFVVIPSKEQMDETKLQTIFKKYGKENEKKNITKINDFFKDVCQRQHIDCLDLYYDFIQIRPPSSLYYSNDDHWNEKGVMLGVELTAKRIEEHNYIN